MGHYKADYEAYKNAVGGARLNWDCFTISVNGAVGEDDFYKIADCVIKAASSSLGSDALRFFLLPRAIEKPRIPLGYPSHFVVLVYSMTNII